MDNASATTPTLTNALRKLVSSLGAARHRRESGLFVAEGVRCVTDSLPHFGCRHLFATAEAASQNPALAAHPALITVGMADIRRMSQLEQPQPVIAVLELPLPQPFTYGGNLTLALDGVQNPGNLGTIIRLADWFGISDILASAGTADCFNPKVVQATMGALARVRVHYVENLAETLAALPAPIVGTLLDGDNLYSPQSLPLEPRPVVVMGNEGNGLSDAVRSVVTHRVRIPSFPPGRATSESLNVAMATGIVISEISRRIYG